VGTQQAALRAVTWPARTAWQGWYGIQWGRLGRARLQLYLIANAFQSLHKAARGTLRVQAIKVIAAVLAIASAVANHVISDDQDAVRHGEGRLFQTAALRYPVKESGEQAILLVGNRPGTLYQDAAQIAIAFPCAAGKPLAGALRIARTQAGPISQMRFIRERAHVRA
jgi:hypothetical protein